MSKILEFWQGMTGTVLPYALTAAPAGWMICDGAVLASGDAPTLRQKLIDDGSPYGDDGAGNPKLPDLRGEFIRGLDNGRGVDPGRALGAAQTDAFKAHQHPISTVYNAGNGGTPQLTWGDGTGTVTELNASSIGGDETRPRNVAMNHIIKT